MIGAGVAGLRAALELAQAGSVLIVAKDKLRESASEYAQGGVAVALSDDDEVALHEHDTLAAGDGLCDPAAVRVLVEDGPRAIQELIDCGAEFDRGAAGALLFGREAAHSRNRILHAHGDSTGREIARALYRTAAALPNVQLHSFSAITDLATRDGEVIGALACDEKERRKVLIRARATLLATGGLGCVYKESTNPEVATGDGVAAAFRAGAEISDIEFVQFHPTALHLDHAPRFLLSEALRGEGAYLRNVAGDRFTDELAPRDVVARAIVAEIRRTGAPHVFLDLTHFAPGFTPKRFPRIYETCLHYGLDLEKQPAPVHPAAHYAMGGVKTDLDGRTSLPRLFAAGEVACTGVHGANRLASNSLLEGVVFGARAGRVMREAGTLVRGAAPLVPPAPLPKATAATLREIAWDCCGIVRDEAGLTRAIRALGAMESEASPALHRAQFETINIHQVVSLIAQCALARRESRGGHYRSDYPAKSPEFQKHSVISKNNAPRFA